MHLTKRWSGCSPAITIRFNYFADSGVGPRLSVSWDRQCSDSGLDIRLSDRWQSDRKRHGRLR